MFKYTPFSIFFLFSSLSSPFSSPPFFPFPLSSLLFSFPFLFLFFFPFSFSLSFPLSLFFLPFSLPFPLFSFLSPFFPFPIFVLLPDFWCRGGAVCPPAPPLATPLIIVPKMKWKSTFGKTNVYAASSYTCYVLYFELLFHIKTMSNLPSLNVTGHIIKPYCFEGCISRCWQFNVQGVLNLHLSFGIRWVRFSMNKMG